jgi:hypothetical protein
MLSRFGDFLLILRAPNLYELLAMFLLLIASIAAIVLFENGAVKLG